MPQRFFRTTKAPSAPVPLFAGIAFVLFTLVTLALVPHALESRAQEMRTQLDQMEEAHALLRTYTDLLSEEALSRRSRLLSDHVKFDSLASEHHARERALLGAVRGTFQALPSEPTVILQEFVESVRQWHRLYEAAESGWVPEEVLSAHLPRQHQRYQRVREAAERLDTHLSEQQAMRLASLEHFSSREELFYRLLVLLSVSSVLLIVVFAVREARSQRRTNLQAEREAALYRLASSLAQTSSVRGLLQPLVQAAASHGPAEGAAWIEWILDEREEVEIGAALGGGDGLAGTRMPRASSLSNRIESEVHLAPEQVERDYAHYPALQGQYLHVIPFRSEGRSLGALVLVSSSPFDYDPVDREALRAIAGLGALALHKSLMIRDAQLRQRDAERLTIELKQAMEMRTNLMRGLSHDIKNPLGAAYGYAELLSEGLLGSLQPEQTRSVQHIQRTIQNAVDMIQDLLDLSRSDAGHLEIYPEATDVTALIAQVAEDHEAEASTAGLAIRPEVRLPSSLLLVDPARLRQILGNLVSNAIRYTPAGGEIVLRARYLSEDLSEEENARLLIEVSDTGPGIPYEHQEAIFQEFSRLETRSRGSGIGLAISRRIARIMGGDIHLSSTPGNGSTFTLSIPAVSVAAFMAV